jgi:hypothetical protein
MFDTGRKFSPRHYTQETFTLGLSRIGRTTDESREAGVKNEQRCSGKGINLNVAGEILPSGGFAPGGAEALQAKLHHAALVPVVYGGGEGGVHGPGIAHEAQ